MTEFWIPIALRLPEEGDCVNGYVLAWHMAMETRVVKRERLTANRFNSHWARVPNEGWISAGDRLPTAEDADAQRCVLARGGDVILVTGWHRLGSTQWESWRRMPPAPENAAQLLKDFYEMI